MTGITAPKGHDCWIRLTEEKAAEWQGIVAQRDLPVITPVPLPAQLPGYAEPQRIFSLALDAMDPKTVRKIADRMAQKFGLSAEQAAEALRDYGIPVREADTETVTVYSPARWLNPGFE